jgi:AcrR family transcriptional regulator
MPQSKPLIPQPGEKKAVAKAQPRSALTAEAIIQAAILAIEDSDELKGVSTKDISKKSGFSVGVLYRYFKNKEHLFASIWSYFITRLHSSLISKLEVFPNFGTVRQLMMLITEHYFDDLKKRNRSKVIKFYRLYIQSSDEPENISKPIDILIKPLDQVIRRNQSGTIRTLEEDEIRIYLRAALAMVRSDFLEGNSFFGTPKHRQFVLDSLVRMFQKSVITE